MNYNSNYELMSVNEIKPYIDLMEKLKVSEIARSKRGFLTHYLKFGRDGLDDSSDQSYMTWWMKREAFLNRTVAALEKNSTLRRYLSCIAWGYLPKNIVLPNKNV